MQLMGGEKLIVSEGGNNFDKSFVSTKTGYSVIVFMKIQFFFKNAGKQVWSEAEKQAFVSSWKSDVTTKWSTASLTKTSDGKNIGLSFRLQTQIGGWMWDHWEITVAKRVKSFETSSVTDFIVNNSRLDDGDVILTGKAYGQKQRASVHEFGHMLGLSDEYLPSSPHKEDYSSVMNRGEIVYPRHRHELRKWADQQVKKLATA